MILGAVAAFIIDRNFDRAAVYALAGAVLSFFGFIHGAKLGVGESSGVALGYLLFAVICWGLTKRAGAPRRASEIPARHGLPRLAPPSSHAQSEEYSRWFRP